MAAKFGSLRQSFVERSKERLLSRKGYSEFGFSGSDGDVDFNDGVRCGCFRSICSRVKVGCYRWICDGVLGCVNGLRDFGVNLYEMGRSDPRKVFFSAKMGLCLVVVSLLIFLTGPLKAISQYAIWAILTVVVCFEYSVGMIPNIFFALYTLSFYSNFKF